MNTENIAQLIENNFSDNDPSLLRKAYYELAKRFHPDRNPADKKEHYNALMQKINLAYENALKSLNGSTQRTFQGKEYTWKYNSEMETRIMEVIEKIMGYDWPDYVNFELVGSWLWCEGIPKGESGSYLREQLKNCSVQDTKTNWKFQFNWNSKRGVFMLNPSKYKARRANVDNDTLKAYHGTKDIETKDHDKAAIA